MTKLHKNSDGKREALSMGHQINLYNTACTISYHYIYNFLQKSLFAH